MLEEQPSPTIHYGFIYDGEERVDEVLLLLMKAPQLYRGEDTVEIDCHGGVYVTGADPGDGDPTWRPAGRAGEF